MGTRCPRMGHFFRAIMIGVGLIGCVDASLILPPTPPGYGPYQAIEPVRASVRYGGQETDAPTVLYDGTGLNNKNPLLAQHSSDPATTWRMPWDATDKPVSLSFDLGDEYLVNEMWLWQLPNTVFPGERVGAYDIVMRDAAGELLTVVDQSGQPKSAAAIPASRFNAFGECVFMPVDKGVRFVELRIYDNLGSLDHVGLEEVSFFGRARIPTVPEPTGLSLLATAGVLLVGRRRRR